MKAMDGSLTFLSKKKEVTRGSDMTALWDLIIMNPDMNIE